MESSLMDKHIEIRFVVNDRQVHDRVDGNRTLLNYLRDTLRLTGAKEGCGKAQCGACTVLVNDRPAKSCSLKLGAAGLIDARIETIEGLVKANGDLHPIQKAFIRAGALQCG